MGILVLSTATAFSHFSSEGHSPSWTDSMQAFHRLQFFKNCSNMGLYHRVQSFRDRLQQHGSPRGCSSYKTSGSTTGFPWVAASFRAHSRSPAWGHSWTVNMFSNMVHHALQGDSLLQHGTLEAAGEHLCSSAWNTSSPSFFTNLGVCRVVSFTFYHFFLPAAVM